MRLTNYLNKLSMVVEDKEKVQKVLEALEKDCKPFLKDMRKCRKGSFLYRGYSVVIDGNIKKVKVRTNRKPKDTPQDLHNAFNDAFKKKFGIEIRSKGVFTTGESSTAVEYGNKYVVFPIGKYSYIWSPDIKDLYSKFEMTDYEYRMEPEDLKWEWKHDNRYREQKVDFKEYYRNYVEEFNRGRKELIDGYIKTYKNTNLCGAINSNNEVMLSCKEYYLVDIMTMILAEYIWGK